MLSFQAGRFRPHVFLRLILALNHTQYKTSWTFSYKRRSKESFDHTRPCTLCFHIYRLATVRQRTRMNIKYRSWAAQLENDETTKRLFLHPSECHIRRTLCEIFMKVVLTTSMTPFENMILYWELVWPLLYVRSCWCFRVLQFWLPLQWVETKWQNVVDFVSRKKGSKTKERMKEEEIEKGDCGPPTRIVFFWDFVGLEPSGT